MADLVQEGLEGVFVQRRRAAVPAGLDVDDAVVDGAARPGVDGRGVVGARAVVLEEDVDEVGGRGGLDEGDAEDLAVDLEGLADEVGPGGGDAVAVAAVAGDVVVEDAEVGAGAAARHVVPAGGAAGVVPVAVRQVVREGLQRAGRSRRVVGPLRGRRACRGRGGRCRARRRRRRRSRTRTQSLRPGTDLGPGKGIEGHGLALLHTWGWNESVGSSGRSGGGIEMGRQGRTMAEVYHAPGRISTPFAERRGSDGPARANGRARACAPGGGSLCPSGQEERPGFRRVGRRGVHAGFRCLALRRIRCLRARPRGLRSGDDAAMSGRRRLAVARQGHGRRPPGRHRRAAGLLRRRPEHDADQRRRLRADERLRASRPEGRGGGRRSARR